MAASRHQAQSPSQTVLPIATPPISLVGSTMRAQPGRHISQHPDAGMEGYLPLHCVLRVLLYSR